MERGKLFVISAPSGAGKTTLIKNILSGFEHIAYSVSHTTRLPRKNEINGVDYLFVSEDEFKLKIEKKEMLEWAKVHDNYYGTSKTFVEKELAKGKNIILDIDVQGAEKIMKSGINLISIFIMPPSIEILRSRLENRGTDSGEVIEKRVFNAKKEMEKKDLYTYQLVNDDLKTAKKELRAIFEKEINT